MTIDEKLDIIIEGQAVQAKMLESILEFFDENRVNSIKQKANLTSYAENLSKILKDKGMPESSIQLFKNLINPQQGQ